MIRFRPFWLLCILCMIVAFSTGCSSNATHNFSPKQAGKGQHKKVSAALKNTAVEIDEEAADKWGKPGAFGYVMDKKAGRVLVVSPIKQDFSATGGVSEYYDAVWVSNMPEKIQLGQKIKVWFHGGVNDSYPGQAGAGEFEILKTPRPDQANFTESEALHWALEKSKTPKGVLTVLSIKYTKETDKWHIELKNTMNGEKYHFQIEDKMTKADAKWNVGSREWYTQGKVTKLQYANHQLVAFALNVITNYHAGADPADDPKIPHPPGKPIKLKLFKPLSKSKVPFTKGSELIVANAMYVLGQSKKTFLGAGIIYYKKNGKYYRLNGQLAKASFSRTARFEIGQLVHK